MGWLGVGLPTASADSRLCVGYESCAASSLTDGSYGAHAGASWWGMYAGHNCTNYVAYRMAVAGVAAPAYRLGNAESWGPAAAAHGVPVDDVPTVGAVAWWSSGAGGVSRAGHVAYVQAVSATSITISEDSYPSGPFDYRVIPTSSGSWPTGFIHFLPATPTALLSGGLTTTGLPSAAATVPAVVPRTVLGARRPTIARGPGASAAVATVGADGSLLLASRAAAAAAWTTTAVTAAGAVTSAPGLVVGAGGLAAVAVAGPHGELLVYGRATAASGWTLEQVAAAGSVVGSPSAVLTGGVLEVATRTPAGALVLHAARIAPARTAAGTASTTAAAEPSTRTWTTTEIAPARSAISDPDVVASPAGVVEIAVTGTGHTLRLWSGTVSGAWGSRVVAGPGSTFGSPSMVRGASGDLRIATLGAGGSVVLRHRAAGTGTWTTARLAGPGSAAASPELVATAGGATSVAAVRHDGALTVWSTSTSARAATAAAGGASARSTTTATTTSTVRTLGGTRHTVSPAGAVAGIPGSTVVTADGTVTTRAAVGAVLVAVDATGTLDIYTQQAGRWTVVSPVD